MEITMDIVGLEKDLKMLGNETLVTKFEKVCTQFSDNVAADFMGRKRTYGDLKDRVDRITQALQKRGLKKGDRVALLLPNCTHFIIFFYAILKAGGVVVNCNPLYTTKELSHQMKDCGARFLISFNLHTLMDKVQPLLDDKLLEGVILCPFPRALPFFKSLLFKVFRSKELDSKVWDDKRILNYVDLLEENDGTPQDVSIGPDDLAVLQYTGGTTGIPKGAMLSHRNIASNVEQMILWTPNLRQGEEVSLSVLPFFHVFGMTAVMNFCLMTGAKQIIVPRFNLKGVLKLIDAEKPTLMAGVPTIFNAINLEDNLADYDMSSLRYCISGGAPLAQDIKTSFESKTKASLVEGYGLSETSPVISCSPFDKAGKNGSAGLIFPGVEVSIRTLESPKTALPLGEKGEICVKGPNVMAGYWHNKEATKTAFVDGFFRTGDVGYIDEDGYLFLLDRIKDIILCGGYNVYPRRIEEALYQHASIAQALVIGVPDDYRGESPQAYIVVKNGYNLTQDEVCTFLEGYISKIEMPRDIIFRKSLPQTLIGKPSRKDLKAELEREHQKK